MSKMKNVTWLANEGFIPNVGVVKKDVPCTMPADMADEFIKQGKAKAGWHKPDKVEEK